MRTAYLIGPVVAVAALAGCSSKDPVAEPPATTTAAAPTTPATTAAPTTSAAPATTKTVPAVTKDGPCPYFDEDFAMATVGQHVPRSTVTSTQPYPGCAFYRPDNGLAIQVQVTQLATPLLAQQKAVYALGAKANPSDVGDKGVVLVGEDGTKLAAAKGRILIQVFINQQSSLQAHDIGAAVAAKIK